MPDLTAAEYGRRYHVSRSTVVRALRDPAAPQPVNPGQPQPRYPAEQMDAWWPHRPARGRPRKPATGQGAAAAAPREGPEQPVVAHLRELRERGCTPAAISAVTEVPVAAIRELLRGRAARLGRIQELALLAVTPEICARAPAQRAPESHT